MLFPDDGEVPDPRGGRTDAPLESSRFLARARDRYDAKLVPIKLQTLPYSQSKGWEYSYTKLLAFNQTQYKHIISLDSDATLRAVCGCLTNSLISTY